MISLMLEKRPHWADEVLGEALLEQDIIGLSHVVWVSGWRPVGLSQL